MDQNLTDFCRKYSKMLEVHQSNSRVLGAFVIVEYFKFAYSFSLYHRLG